MELHGCDGNLCRQESKLLRDERKLVGMGNEDWVRIAVKPREDVGA